MANVKFNIGSGFRCRIHNESIPGSAYDSSHLIGHAGDIKTPSMHYRYRVLFGVIMAGFKRIGIYKTHIHVDDDPSKTPGVSWYS